MFPGLELQTEIDQRSFETCSETGKDRKPSTRDLCCALKIQDTQRRSEVDMISRLERKRWRRSPAFDLLICRLIAAHWNGLVREIRQTHQDIVELFLYCV